MLIVLPFFEILLDFSLKHLALSELVVADIVTVHIFQGTFLETAHIFQGTFYGFAHIFQGTFRCKDKTNWRKSKEKWRKDSPPGQNSYALCAYRGSLQKQSVAVAMYSSGLCDQSEGSCRQRHLCRFHRVARNPLHISPSVAW